MAASLLIGCDDDARPPSPPTAQSSAAERRAVALPAHKEPNPDEIKATIDASGRKWLTPTVPYDLFAEVPSQEVAAGPVRSSSGDPSAGIASVDRAAMNEPGSASLQTDTVQSVPEAKPEVAPSDGGAPPSTVGSGWGDLLPIEALQQEVAAVRNSLSESLLTVGSYNTAFEQVAIDAWEMSALATIIAEHPGTISWKGEALLARDAAVAIATAATARGRQNFIEAQSAREQLSAILNNNTPAGLPTPDPNASREETADRAALMARLQSAFDHLKEAAADEANFRKDRLRTEHEATILASLARFVTDSDYGAAEEADYQAAADVLVEDGVLIAGAAASEDFATFRSALDRAGNACNDCHRKYRFEN